MSVERLQKVMAHFGVASRRKCEELIASGSVTVNGRIVTEMGVKVDPDADVIEVNGRILKTMEDRVYYVLNKPVGYVTTVDDPQGRRTVIDLVAGVKQRVYPVGRLDYDTEGLLLMTNDGDMTYALTHPSHQVEKGYLVEVKGQVAEHEMRRLRKGVQLEDGWTAPARVSVVHKTAQGSVLEMWIHEGRNRQIRRMMDAVGHPVVRLKRFQFGPIDLAELPVGRYRGLSKSELKALKQIAATVLKQGSKK